MSIEQSLELKFAQPLSSYQSVKANETLTWSYSIPELDESLEAANVQVSVEIPETLSSYVAYDEA